MILGSGDVGMIMARRLTVEGGRVKAVIEVLPYVGGLIRNEVQYLCDFEIPVMLKHTITEVHGNERVEAVTVSQVDESWNPIAGTDKVIECDTLLISAGLIPENELSRMAGIELYPLTGGPVVDNTMQTSIPGIFAGGNVVHVNDLVDNVSWEGEIAGASAAYFTMGKAVTKKPKINLRLGENLRYVVPQSVSVGEETTISIRIAEPAENVLIEIGNVLSKGLKAVKPSEMIKLTIPSKEWSKISGEITDLEVSCRWRR